MPCFHFPGDSTAAEDVRPRLSRLSWARSFSAASTSSSSLGFGPRRAAELDLDWDALRPPPPPRAPMGPPEGLRAFGFTELKAATKGFSRAVMIGEGGFGCVYRGELSVDVDGDGGVRFVDVAVKQLNRSGCQGHKEWTTEVNFLGIAKHPNLVKLIGYCAEDDERGIQRLLVYEFMPNKSLEDHLLSRASRVLSWELRLKIARDAARGLAYLHEEMEFQLIFRDFKTSNVLLDEDFNAKLSDFGFVRHGPAAGIDHVSTAVVGTVGYAAPEYVHSGKLTSKSDVWSFGVVLYELLTGRRSVDRNLPRCEQMLLEWVKPYATDAKKFHVIIDPRLEGQCCIQSAQKLVNLANRCLMKQPKCRPTMSEVVDILENIIEMSNEPTSTVSTSFPAKHRTERSERWERRGNYVCKVFDLKEIITLRNRSVGKSYWRTLAVGSVGKMMRTSV